MAIALADLLDEKQVILRLRSRKPANAIREIVQVLAHNGKIDMPETFLEQVFARERAHPSVVENGVAFPHARTDLVNQIVLGIGRSRAGLLFRPPEQRWICSCHIARPRTRRIKDRASQLTVGGCELRVCLTDSNPSAHPLE